VNDLDAPPALETPYRTPEPNSPITLYSGRLRLIQDAGTEEGSGTVELVWLPNPKLVFSVPSLVFGTSQLDECTLELVERGWSCSAGVTSRGSGGARGMIDPGIHASGAVGPSGSSIVNEVRFHVPNFLEKLRGAPLARRDGNGWYSGRTVMKLGEWSVVVDAVEPGVEERLNKVGGIAFTHVVSMRRENGAPFDASGMEDFISRLERALSFCLGRWTGATLLSGYDSGGQLIWEDWRLPWVQQSERGFSWFPSYYSEGVLEKFLSGYLAACSDPVVADSLGYCVHWYVEANASAAALETSMILILMGLELLAWLELVNRGGLDRDVFERTSAGSKIRKYLNAKGIASSGVAADMPDLEKYIRSEANCPDWLEGLTRIRNRTVHPPKTAFRKYPIDLLEQGWRFALYLLERSIMAEANYHGYAHKRIEPTWPEVIV
jgi:hypothetical protein